MVEAQTKEYLVTENTVDRKKTATSDAGDKKIPAQRKESVVVAVEEVHGNIMDEKLLAASKVDNAPLKKKACMAKNKIMPSPCAKSPPQKKKQSILAKKTFTPSPAVRGKASPVARGKTSPVARGKPPLSPVPSGKSWKES
eukprot:9303476-Ditylum_brightwellii.AAC.1